MTMPPDGEVETQTPKVPPTTAAQPVGAGITGNVESQTTAEGFGVSNVVQKWRRDDLLKKGSLALRISSLIFSLLAFIIMATNKHGDWKDFDKYEEYRYVLAIAIISTLYTGLQALLQLNELSCGREIILRHHKMMLDFFGDQLLAYLLLSAASSAVPLTNRMREGTDNIFTDSSAAAISMEILAFFSLGLSAVISGYKLCNQSYI